MGLSEGGHCDMFVQRKCWCWQVQVQRWASSPAADGCLALLLCLDYVNKRGLQEVKSGLPETYQKLIAALLSM